MSDLLPKKKDIMKSIRFKQETIDFLETVGPVATVARSIIEKAIKNWPEFEDINSDNVRKQGNFKRYMYGDFDLDGLTLRSAHGLLNARLKCREDVEHYIKNVGELLDIEGIGTESLVEITEWLEG